jgi:hypothetical protein
MGDVRPVEELQAVSKPLAKAGDSKTLIAPARDSPASPRALVAHPAEVDVLGIFMQGDGLHVLRSEGFPLLRALTHRRRTWLSCSRSAAR